MSARCFPPPWTVEDYGFLSVPATWPLFGSTKCTRLQAMHVTVS
jgi:hypothetical protein